MIASTQTNHPLTSVEGTSPSTSGLKPIQVATAKLKAAGMRITQPRIAILEAMIRFGRPASIEQIHAELTESSCDLVTVYRCLAVFEELGLVRRSFLPNGTAIYEINIGGENRYHVICKSSNRVEEIDAETTAELRDAIRRIEDLLRERGYSDVTHVVEFFGVSGPMRRVHGNAAMPATRS